MTLQYNSIIGELESAIAAGSSETRVAKLRQITDLYLSDAARFSDEQIDVFDDVLCLLINRIETRARTELSTRLAPVANAPQDTLRKLAYDDEISVAGPILTGSTALCTADLVDIAKTKSQDHLLAISNRTTVEADVTTVIIKRGDQRVVKTLARNAGAQFSDEGYSALTARAETDDDLAEIVGLRLDLPAQFLRELLARASKAVREKLLALMPESVRAEVERTLEAIANAVGREVYTTRNYTAAEQYVTALHKKGELNDTRLLEFADEKDIEKIGAALALLSGATIDMISRLMQSPRTDTLLIPCKVANLRWPTVASILRNRHPGHTVPEQILTLAHADYIKLAPKTAERTLRFWKVREKVDETTAA